jgi:hypothetical protein
MAESGIGPVNWNARSSSTSYSWNPVKIRRSRQGHVTAASSRAAYLPLVRRNWFKPLSMTMCYMGGPEGTVVIVTRGARWVIPGGVTVLETLQWINGRAEKDPS